MIETIKNDFPMKIIWTFLDVDEGENFRRYIVFFLAKKTQLFPSISSMPSSSEKFYPKMTPIPAPKNIAAKRNENYTFYYFKLGSGVWKIFNL